MTPQATAEQPQEKIAQAHRVIAHLLEQAGYNGGDGERALDYFSSGAFDPDFLP